MSNKLKLFEYVMILHPESNGNKKAKEKSVVVKDLDRVLAGTEKEALMLIAREIPEEYLDELDRLEIAIRPF